MVHQRSRAGGVRGPVVDYVNVIHTRARHPSERDSQIPIQNRNSQDLVNPGSVNPRDRTGQEYVNTLIPRMAILGI